MSKPSGFAVAIFAITMVFVTPLFALLDAAIFAEIWDRLLAHQYGAGPSYRAWYGLSVISGLMMFGLAYEINRKDENEFSIGAQIGRLAGQYIGKAIVLGLVIFTCLMLGWR